MKESQEGISIGGGYPPPHHILRDLLITLEFKGERRCVVRAPVVPEICIDEVGVQAGAAATLVDVLGGGLALRAFQPDWIATEYLSVFMTGRPGSGTLGASGTVIRAGKTRGVMEVDLFAETDSPDRSSVPVGSAMMTFSRLPRKEYNIEIQAYSVEEAAFGAADSALSRPYADQVGVRVLDGEAGVVEVDMSGYIRNSFKALHGGVVALLVDVSGQVAGRAALGKPVVTRDLAIHYLSQGKVGPFRTRASVLRASSGTALTRVEVRDSGANNRLMSIGMNTAIDSAD